MKQNRKDFEKNESYFLTRMEELSQQAVHEQNITRKLSYYKDIGDISTYLNLKYYHDYEGDIEWKKLTINVEFAINVLLKFTE